MKAVRLKEVSPLDELRELSKSLRGASRRVPEEIKARALEICTGGFSASEVAGAVGVHPTSLFRWARERPAVSPFRPIELQETSTFPSVGSTHVVPPSSSAPSAVADNVVFRFPKGTNVTVPTSHAALDVIEALLRFERE